MSILTAFHAAQAQQTTAPATSADALDEIVVNGIKRGELILPTTVTSTSAFGLDLGVLMEVAAAIFVLSVRDRARTLVDASWRSLKAVVHGVRRGRVPGQVRGAERERGGERGGVHSAAQFQPVVLDCL